MLISGSRRGYKTNIILEPLARRPAPTGSLSALPLGIGVRPEVLAMIIYETREYRIEQLDTGSYTATISGLQFGGPPGIDIKLDDSSAEKLQFRVEEMVKGANTDIKYRSLAPRVKQAALF